MAYRNPHYDPEWQTIHDRHAEERARAKAEMDRLIAAGKMRSTAYERAKATYDRHHQACLSSFRMQHETVQDYAAWLFRTFHGTGEGLAIPVPQPDIAAFRTLEEAEAAWSRIDNWMPASPDKIQGSLPN